MPLAFKRGGAEQSGSSIRAQTVFFKFLQQRCSVLNLIVTHNYGENDYSIARFSFCIVYHRIFDFVQRLSLFNNTQLPRNACISRTLYSFVVDVLLVINAMLQAYQSMIFMLQRPLVFAKTARCTVYKLICCGLWCWSSRKN